MAPLTFLRVKKPSPHEVLHNSVLSRNIINRFVMLIFLLREKTRKAKKARKKNSKFFKLITVAKLSKCSKLKISSKQLFYPRVVIPH